ncbi:MAG: hypothetical protein GY705_16800, partial [Bacteroidetes bacterium]|nr:hypothetical protein [Bacteroidota bacterium]
IFGGPGETQATIEESFSFIDAHVAPDDMVNITEGLRIYPDTHLADLARQEGVIGIEQSLLMPEFYVSPLLQDTDLSELINVMIHSRPNCIRITDTKPPPELLRAALHERKEKDLKEPMFRTLLRIKREKL